jgi:vitamin B12 transporter
MNRFRAELVRGSSTAMFTMTSRIARVPAGRWTALVFVFAAFDPTLEPVAAQPVPAAARDESAQPSVIAPTLVYAPAPRFPEAAIAAGIVESTVVLRVTIDARGLVSAAEVMESAGDGFDEAAQQAASAYRFEPARREGEPVAARILLKVEFRQPSPAVEASPPPEPAPALVTAGARPARSSAAVEVKVQGQSQAEHLRRSAEAVHVVETAEAKRRTSDLGEVLARTQGVGVQRAGGVGSDMRFSLNGLTDDQVRFFLDGVPLEFAGYPFGIANIPVNLVERVEIYRGVVPIRFGADTLGGAVNVVGDRRIRGSHASASLQAGSFGTYLTTLSAQHLDEGSGWFNRVSGFIDRAENDYAMDIEVPDALGREQPAHVYRFHDGYRAEGVNLETGLVGKPGAKRLLLRGFVTHFDKEIQHNLVMTFNPYGDITLSELSAGGTVRYENSIGERVRVGVVAGYAHGQMRYTDVGECVYDWFGQCVRPRPQPGERNGRAEDQLYQEHSAYGRVNVDYKLHPNHVIGVSLSPTYVSRTGDEQRQAKPDARDPLSAQRQLFGLVAGIEHKAHLIDGRLENALFFKDYLQVLRSEDPLPSGNFQERDRETHRFGLGDALRYVFAPSVYAKASYEWATRLPRPDEIFGNAFPVQPNLQLEPELSHNINLGITLDVPLQHAGRLRADVNGFVRDADQLIVLVGTDKTSMYQNVYSARSLGAETAFGWTSPGEYIALDGNVTYVDFRNTSTTGAFARSEGERIPNRPYLFGNLSARFQLRRVAAPRDELALIWATRYVHAFFRGWEGIGTDKLTVDAQVLHALALTYVAQSDPVSLSFTGEVQNLTDQAAFDFFGVQRPGRAFFFKATASL